MTGLKAGDHMAPESTLMLILIVLAALWGGMHSAPAGPQWDAGDGHMAPTVDNRFRDRSQAW